MTARSHGLQFDDEPWICGYCKAECIDYPTMKEHHEKRCRVRKAIQRGKFGPVPPSVMDEGQRLLEEWGVR